MPKIKYIWDDEDDVVLMEKDENGATTAVYTHEPGLHGELISQRRGETTSYYHYDGLGSTVALTNASEEVTDTFRYRAYGDPIVRTGTTENPFRWVGSLGYYWDEELGQYYVRARHYDPGLACWLSVDPIGYRGKDFNLRRYVRNNPLTFVDLSGKVMQRVNKLYEEIIEEAERRRGRGPWRGSAQHCWAACFIGARYGIGSVAAIIADNAENFPPSGEAVRDMVAQHFGGAAGDSLRYNPACPVFVPDVLLETFCDATCLTWPRPR